MPAQAAQCGGHGDTSGMQIVVKPGMPHRRETGSIGITGNPAGAAGGDQHLDGAAAAPLRARIEHLP